MKMNVKLNAKKTEGTNFPSFAELAAQTTDIYITQVFCRPAEAVTVKDGGLFSLYG